MKNSLLKYRIGLVVLVVLAAGLAVYVAMGAGDHKADLETKKAADKVAEQLNNYVFAGGAPESLAAAGIKDVPSTIKYTQLSDSKYKFCVTYKAANSGFDANAAVQETAMGLSMGSMGGDFSMADSGYLYVESTHKKGENCQTVTLPGRESTTPSNLFMSPSLNYGTEGTPSLDGLDGSGSGDSLTTPPSMDTPDSYQYPVQ